MTKQVFANTAYAVRDRASGKFLSHRRKNGLSWSWTDDPAWFHLFKTEQIAHKSANGNEVVRFSIAMIVDVVVNVELERRDKFSACVGRFTQLELKNILTEREDAEHRRLRRTMRQLDEDRYQEVKEQIKKIVA